MEMYLQIRSRPLEEMTKPFFREDGPTRGDMLQEYVAANSQ